jgi:hypothetical protein
MLERKKEEKQEIKLEIHNPPSSEEKCGARVRLSFNAYAVCEDKSGHGGLHHGCIKDYYNETTRKIYWDGDDRKSCQSCGRMPDDGCWYECTICKKRICEHCHVVINAFFMIVYRDCIIEKGMAQCALCDGKGYTMKKYTKSKEQK